MNILYDYSIFQIQRYGGISRYFYELIRRISNKEITKISNEEISKISNEENIEIDLFEGFHINEYGLSNYTDNFEKYFGYKRPSIKYTGLFFAKLNGLLFDHFYKSLDNCDIFHPTYYRNDLNNFKEVPIVLTVYDMIHELYYSNHKDSKSIINAKKISIDYADFIICISQNTKKDLIRFYNVPENKIKVIYLGNSFRPSEYTEYMDLDQIKRLYNIDKPYILFVGVRGGCKNFSLLLEAYKYHFSNKFDLVSLGENRLEIIKKSNLFKNIFIIKGHDELLASLYKNAFCLVFPSLYEGFGIPVLEAMGIGCPIVASNASSIPEVVGDAALLFDPHSINNLVESIELLYDENERNKLINLGFEQEKKFSWDKTVNETLEVYENLRR